MPNIDQHAHIEQVVAAIQQRWGKQALHRLERIATDSTGIASGYPALDTLLSTGGIPRGAVTCLTGSPTSGKTTLALDVLARVQQAGEVTVYIDMTRTLDPEYAETRTVDLEHLLIICPESLMTGLAIARDIVAGDGAGLLVLGIDPYNVTSGTQAALARSLRHLSSALRRAPYALLCLTARGANPFSAPLTTRADVHLRMHKQRWLFNQGRLHGYEVLLTVIKNRFGPPGQSATLPVLLNTPIQRSGP